MNKGEKCCKSQRYSKFRQSIRVRKTKKIIECEYTDSSSNSSESEECKIKCVKCKKVCKTKCSESSSSC